MKNQRTERLSAYDPWCPSYRKKAVRQPCCPGAEYDQYHHRMLDTLTLIDQKEQLRNKAQELITNAEKEIRKLNDGEATELNHLKKEIASRCV